eukprot:SAG31_NODE_12748_length_919_cov_1.371951_1_plen_283_part_10
MLALGGAFAFTLLATSHAAGGGPGGRPSEWKQRDDLLNRVEDAALSQILGLMWADLQEGKQENARLKQDNAGLEKRVTALEAQLQAYEEKLDAITAEVRNDLGGVRTETTALHVELEQCAAGAVTFAQHMEAIQSQRRQMQEVECHGTGIQNMLAVCCPSGSDSGHRRELQGYGCAAFPVSCSVACASMYVKFYETCDVGAIVGASRAAFETFYGQCQEAEASAAAMMDAASPAMIFKVLVVPHSPDVEGSGSALSLTPPARRNSAERANAAMEFRRICTTAN